MVVVIVVVVDCLSWFILQVLQAHRKRCSLWRWGCNWQSHQEFFEKGCLRNHSASKSWSWRCWDRSASIPSEASESLYRFILGELFCKLLPMDCTLWAYRKDLLSTPFLVNRLHGNEDPSIYRLCFSERLSPRLEIEGFPDPERYSHIGNLPYI